MAKKKGPYGSSTNCFGCHHGSAKQADYGIYLCSVCHIVEEQTDRGTMVYVQTLGEDRKPAMLRPKR